MTQDTIKMLKEAKTDRYETALLHCIDYELEGVVSHVGGKLLGFSVKFGEGEVLLTLRVVFEEISKIGFVGSGNLGDCLLKAVREVMSGKLQWREDKYPQPQT